MNITILNTHMMAHTEEKPYQCHDCGQHCIDNETFIEHIKIHNTAKPYKCSYCQKSFLLTNIWCHTQMKILISVMTVGGFYKQWYLYRTYEDHINVTSHTSAGIVKRVSYITFIWKDTWEDTLERNHINVVSVISLSHKAVFLHYTWKHTLRRNHILIASVIRLLYGGVILKHIWEYTLGKKHINAIGVIRHLHSMLLLHHIWEHTPERNHINAVIMIWLSQRPVI